MKVGIVGLPNVGKSTVFNSLTQVGAEAQNYPFTTIDPNLGVVSVPDRRLGNQFLGNIRECEAIAHIVRCFEDENVAHMYGGVDPAGDIETINTELLLADLATVEKRFERVGRAAKSGNAGLRREVEELEKLIHHLSNGTPARTYPPSDALAEVLGTLITAKPTIYV